MKDLALTEQLAETQFRLDDPTLEANLERLGIERGSSDWYRLTDRVADLRAGAARTNKTASVYPHDPAQTGRDAPTGDVDTGASIVRDADLVVGREPPYTDAGNAERFAAEHQGDVIYVPGPGWHVWDGTRYRPDDDGAVTRLAMQTARAMMQRAWDLDADDPAAKPLRSHAYYSEREPSLRRLVKLAAAHADMVVHADRLDADPLLLNVENGIVDLATGDLRPHDRRAYCTKLANVAYDPDAHAPVWEQHVARVMGGRDTLVEYLRRSIGYALTGLTSEQSMFVWYGGGKNGKTKTLEVIRALLGDYAKTTPAETLLARRDTIPNDIARLRGARLVAATETPDGRQLNAALVKRLTGEDNVAARFMHAEWFEFRPLFKLILATNHKPVVRENTEAMWRRIKLVPFDIEIPEPDRDPNIADKLLLEAPGILNWALAGLADWQENGLQAPDEVTAATAGYRADMDAIGSWIEEKCVLNPDIRGNRTQLWRSFSDWSGRDRDLTAPAFYQELERRGYEPVRGARGRFHKGIALKTEGSLLGEGE